MDPLPPGPRLRIVYTGRGQEAVRASARLALGPDDVFAPLNRELACHLARGVTARGGLPQLPRQGRLADARARRQHALRRARARRLPAGLDARRLCPVIVGAALAFKRRGRRASRSRSGATAP